METSVPNRPQSVTYGVLSVLCIEIDYLYDHKSSSNDNKKEKLYSGASSENPKILFLTFLPIPQVQHVFFFFF